MSTKPSMELTRDGDNWELTTKSTFSNSTIKFKLGEEYDDPVPGIVMKVKILIKLSYLVLSSEIMIALMYVYYNNHKTNFFN